jgi:hypothetical protein
MSKNNATIVKKYCKVCHDAGKSEDEYRSHCTRETRDIKSKVLCPTLLALECRYCYQAGHTVKYCPVLKEKEKISTVREKGVRRDEALVRYTESSITISSNKTKKPNAFACLDAASDEDDQKVSKKSVVKEDYPVLCAPIKRAPVSKSNYAAALASVPAVKAPTPAPWALASNDRPKAAKISWAAMASDSEDDEEEEDEEVEVEEEDW